jgi:DNA-binding response OmpR family regulator
VLVLVVTPAPGRFRTWTAFLERSGLRVRVAGPGPRELASVIGSDAPDVVLVDTIGQDGAAVAVRRHLGQLHAGAAIGFLGVSRPRAFRSLPEEAFDDLLAEAAEPAEVLFRVRRAAARRLPSRLEIGALTIDRLAAEVLVAGRRVVLGQREFHLLTFLASHPQQVFRREDLLHQVWGPAFRGSVRTVDVCVRRLRAALGTFGDRVETVLGVGYRLSPRGE